MNESGPGPTFIHIHNGTVITTVMHNRFGPASSPRADEVIWLEAWPESPVDWGKMRQATDKWLGVDRFGLGRSVQGTARLHASTSAPNGNSLHSESAAGANVLPCAS